ncbi:hypothetical protein HY417_01240 [Candidatus Kaiserbacteria bacterium]|nr:hypothetical protein [Candidatus Kaiserbacteria bacterium]
MGAIFASSYVQYGIPYLEEQEKMKNDEQRIADLNALDAEIKSTLVVNPSAFTGASTTVYISLPSNNPLCTNLELPSLPEGWTYHCAPQNNFTNTNGTGWLPINFATAEHSNILENVGMLPVDPLNSADTLNYYAAVGRSTFSTTTAATTTEYVLTAVLDSKKYLTEKAQTDNGSDPIRYEVGLLPKLWSDASGLVGYWPLNETNTAVARDISGNQLDGQVLGLSEQNNTSIGIFDGKSSYVFIPASPVLNTLGRASTTYSIGLSFYLANSQDGSLTEKWINGGAYPYALRIENSQVVFGTYDGKKWIGTSADGIKYGQWNVVAAVVDADNGLIQIYLNGKLGGSILYEFGKTDNNSGLTVGVRNLKKEFLFHGSIRNLRIYERALNDVEVNMLFVSAQ